MLHIVSPGLKIATLYLLNTLTYFFLDLDMYDLRRCTGMPHKQGVDCGG